MTTAIAVIDDCGDNISFRLIKKIRHTAECLQEKYYSKLLQESNLTAMQPRRAPHKMVMVMRMLAVLVVVIMAVR